MRARGQEVVQFDGPLLELVTEAIVATNARAIAGRRFMMEVVIMRVGLRIPVLRAAARRAVREGRNR